MELLLIIFSIQGLLGAFDTIYHHELTERLPWQPTAAKELKLHGVRNFFYSIIFISLAWIAWEGVFAWIFFAILLIEVVITLMDFVEEDKSRKLPATERITHTILALNYGVILALLIPILWQWSQASSGFSRMNFGVLSWIMTLYAVGVFVWAWRDLLRGLAFSKKSPKPQLMVESLDKPNQKILVTGGTGFIGKIFCQAMIDQGHHVTLLTRNIEKAANLFRGKITLIDCLDVINDHDNVDIIINLAGETISQRWNAKTQTTILKSRINTTQHLIDLIQRLEQKPRVFISGSAIGIYGTSQTISFTEETLATDEPPGEFPKKICTEWEAVAQKAENYSVRTCLLRTGIVLETDGGALAQMLFPFEFGLGGPMGSGRQWFSWIHRHDFIRTMIYLINNKNIQGPVNAVAPEAVTNCTFSKALGKAMKRPAILPLPAFQVKLLFGKMGESLLLAGQKVVPQKLVENGFVFHFPSIDSALKQIFTR